MRVAFASRGRARSSIPGSTPQHAVEREHGKTGNRRALRARADSRRGRRGRPVLQGPVLGAADGERRNCPGVRGVLSEVPESSMSDASGRALRAFVAAHVLDNSEKVQSALDKYAQSALAYTTDIERDPVPSAPSQTKDIRRLQSPTQ